MSASALSIESAERRTQPARIDQTVLIVDDSEGARRRVEQALTRHGVAAHCLMAPNGADALRLMSKHKITLVLCDVEMPSLDGFHFLRIKHRHAEFADIPVIMVTVKEEVSSKIQALTEGAADYLSKPYHDEELVARVNVHLKLKRLQDELRQKNARLEQVSRTDGLTGLFNRRHFIELLESELSRSLRYGPPLSLVMVDVDHFKAVNDQYGHLAGDAALGFVADVFTSMLRKCDHPARYGGEEFALLLPQTDPAGARILAERVRDAIEVGECSRRDAALRITASLGVASFPWPGLQSVDDLIRAADRALYAAKAAGRNRVCSWGD